MTGAVVGAQQLEQLRGLGRHFTDQNLAILLQVLLRLQHIISSTVKQLVTNARCQNKTTASPANNKQSTRVTGNSHTAAMYIQ